jgi:phytoene dehydrogenase-like protein
VVVGSGPNGLAAAVALARSGWSVLVREAHEVVGGGLRSAELTLPGFVHDICSAVHPLAVASPFFRTLPLAEYGLEWVHPSAPLAHPFDDATLALVERSVDATGATLGADADAYRCLVDRFVAVWPALMEDVLAPLRLPRRPMLLARFGLRGLQSAHGLARRTFREERARALFAGIAAHSTVSLTRSPTAAFGLLLSIAGHAVGWPVARGGSQRIADALSSYLRSLGGEIVTGAPVETIDELPTARAVLLDLTPRQILPIAGHRLPSRYRRALERYRYGVGAFKIDWALDGPIPWTAPECLRAGTVHLGGTLAELTAAESAPWRGKHPDRPFVLLGQPSLFDPSRAPVGKHIAWAYSHVPHGSVFDMTSRIEDQVERFAPGFRERILARHVMPPAALERHDANLVGGDISGGVMDLGQLFFRPTVSLTPYATPVKGLYICSSSTPPGGAVHGMCGYYAARAVLDREGRPTPDRAVSRAQRPRNTGKTAAR